LWDTNSKKVITSRDVKFLETQSNLDEALKLDLDKEVDIDADSRESFDNIGGRDTDEPTEDSESIIEAPQTTAAPEEGHATTDNTADNVTSDAVNGGTRKSTRTRRAPGQWWSNCAFVSSTTDPTTLHQAMKRSDSGLWKDAMKSEYKSLLKHGMWKLVTRPQNVHVTPCKWVFKTKLLKNDAGLEVQKYKARLVSKGYSQIHVVDYEETFAPVVKFT
jgi:Reverse transcriptase (RNA-dependent DNA polymerase)